MARSIQIGSRLVGQDHPCFVIGELSCNHSGDFQQAVDTIKAMHRAGVDCVKLQTFKPDSITIACDKPEFTITGGTPWDNKKLHDLYTEAQTPWEWHKPLQELARSLGMEFMSSPFDHEAVDFLESLSVPAYKIASFEITDIPLIELVASKGKPVIMSTGVARQEDIQDAIAACHRMGNDQVVLLKCTSSYPTPLEDVNLRSIGLLAETFGFQVGLSDHTLGSVVPVGAVALGATVVEKHFILDRAQGGLDAAFSMQPEEFKEMIASIRNLEKALGVATLKLSDKSLKNRFFARSLYVVEDIEQGEALTEHNLRSVRPSFGLPPKHFNDIIGKNVNQKLTKGTALSWTHIGENGE
jgi:pseudaminic acid synthase